MRFIAPLLRGQRRDVLVNVMFDHINRFKDDPRAFLRAQMREFFGLGESDLPEALGEEELFALYRTKLKELCGVQYAADLAIPHPTVDRTKFRLVVGGKNPAVLELFRSIEKKVIGSEAAIVRDDASTRKEQARTGQSRCSPRLVRRTRTTTHFTTMAYVRRRRRSQRGLRRRVRSRSVPSGRRCSSATTSRKSSWPRSHGTSRVVGTLW